MKKKTSNTTCRVGKDKDNIFFLSFFSPFSAATCFSSCLVEDKRVDERGRNESGVLIALFFLWQLRLDGSASAAVMYSFSHRTHHGLCLCLGLMRKLKAIGRFEKNR